MSRKAGDSLSITGVLFILFVLLGLIGLFIEFPVQVGLIGGILAVTIYGWVLKAKRETLSDEQETLTQHADELDKNIFKLSDSTVESNWKELAATIPTPTLSPITQSTVQTKIEELGSKVNQRRNILRKLEELQERRDFVEAYCEHEIRPIQIYAIAQQIARTDSKQVDTIQSKIILENSKLIIHAFHELKESNQTLKQTKTKTLIDSIANSTRKVADVEYLSTLAELMAKLVTIERYQPEIQTRLGVEQLNTAIENSEHIASAEATISTSYQLFEFSEKIDDFLTDVDLTHTSLTAEECRVQIESAILANDLSQLNSLLTKIDQIAELSWDRADLYTYDWQSFEHLIGDLWASKGYETTVTVGTADEGIDVRAIKTSGTSDHVIIQVKQYKQDNKVGRPDIQKTLGTLSTDKATRAIVVTSSSFTKPAITEATKAGHQIELVDGAYLLELLSKSHIAPPIGNRKNNRSRKYIPQYNVEQTVLEVLQNPTTISHIFDPDVSIEQQTIQSVQDTLNTLQRKRLNERDIDKIIKSIQRSLLPSNIDVSLVIELSNSIKARTVEKQKSNGSIDSDYVLDVVNEEIITVVSESGELQIDSSTPAGQSCSENTPQCRDSEHLTEQPTEKAFEFCSQRDTLDEDLNTPKKLVGDSSETNSEHPTVNTPKTSESESEDTTSRQEFDTETNQNALVIQGKYLSIELLGCDHVQGTVITPGPYSEPEDEINGLVIALEIQHSYEKPWYFFAADSLEVVDSENITYQPGDYPFGFADLPAPWRSSLTELSPSQSYRYATTITNFSNPLQKIVYRADPSQQMEIKVDKLLSLNIDQSLDDLPDLPTEIQSIIEYK